MASPALVTRGPPAGGLRPAASPGVVASLVAPAIAATPCLWVALACGSADDPLVTVEAVTLSGVLLALAGTNATRAHAYACGESVDLTRRRQARCFALCAIGAALATLAGTLASPASLALVTAAATAACPLAIVGVTTRRRAVLLAGVVALNLAWGAALVLVVLGVVGGV